MPHNPFDASVPAEDRQTRSLLLILAIALIAGVGIMGLEWCYLANGGGDENGYLLTGKLLADHGSPAFVPRVGPDGVVPTYVGDMWVGTDLGTREARYYAKYPLGFPALVALTLVCCPQSLQLWAVYLLNPVSYCVGLFAVFLLTRRLAGSVPALAAICGVAFSGVIIRMFSIPGSHGPSFALVSWSAYLLARWMQDGGLLAALGAGLLCGAAAAVRSAEGVLVLPLVIAAITHTRRPGRAHRARQAAAMIASWLLIVGTSAIAQHALTGTWTGYSATGEHSSFAISYLVDHWYNVARAISMRGIGLLAPLGVVGLVVIWQRNWRTGLVLTMWVVANALVYASYYWSSESQLIPYGRFYLPSYAVLAAAAMVATVWPLRRLGWPRMANAATVAVVAISTAIIIYDCDTFAELDVLRRTRLEDRLNWMQERVPADAVLLCDETDMLNDLQFSTERWLYDYLLFDESAVQRLVENDRPDRLNSARREWLRKTFLPLGQKGLTEMRDRMIAAHITAGRRVFVFCGPDNRWRD